MIKSYLLNGEFKEREFDNFTTISESINKNRNKIYNFKIEMLVEFLSNLGKEIIEDDEIIKFEGVNYISLWLRKDNLKKICRLNFYDQNYFENFAKIEGNYELCIQPRGIVCHWIAANIPTLAFFSLVQAILSKNGSIVKIPEQNKDIILLILKKLSETNLDFDQRIYSGKDIVKSISVVSFDSKNIDNCKDFSLIADCKIIWGGSEAVKHIITLPQKDYCETIIFGPKYSFGVFDKEFIESTYFDKALGNSVLDVVIFNQMACSSPHVYFFEKNKYTIKEIAERMAFYFKKIPDKFFRQKLPQAVAANIINARAVYLLEDNKEILSSDDLSWTILINENINLEEPIQGKCIFIKEIDNINMVLDLVTRKVQAVSACILSPRKKREFAKEVTFRGVDRVVMPGQMHDFVLPWDGILLLNRLVRWVILREK